MMTWRGKRLFPPKLCTHAITGERYIDDQSFEAFNLTNFLRARGLYKTVIEKTKSYTLRTIREVYGHIRTTEFGNPFSVQRVECLQPYNGRPYTTKDSQRGYPFFPKRGRIVHCNCSCGGNRRSSRSKSRWLMMVMEEIVAELKLTKS